MKREAFLVDRILGAHAALEELEVRVKRLSEHATLNQDILRPLGEARNEIYLAVRSLDHHCEGCDDLCTGVKLFTVIDPGTTDMQAGDTARWCTDCAAQAQAEQWGAAAGGNATITASPQGQT